MVEDSTERRAIDLDKLIYSTPLTKRYVQGSESIRAVEGVVVTLLPAEILVVLGPSGCGKSTLLQLMSGIDSPDDGQVFFRGRAIHELSEPEAAEMRATNFGFVLQQGNLVPSLSLIENVALPLLCSGMSRRDAFAKATVAMERVGIAHRASALPGEVSGGESQRAAIARACINEQKVIFADEPTGALDSEAAENVRNIFRSTVEELGASIVLVTHDPKTAEIASRTIVMHDGAIVDEY